MSYKTFQNGFPLPASDLNNYLMNQVVATFANSTARSSAIASPQEGQVTYLEDTESYEKWDGSAWVDFFPEAVAATSPNYIINGAFDIWQRGTSFTPTSAAWTYSADRWDLGRATGTSGATVTRQSSGLTGFEYSLRYQRNSSDTSTSALYLVHRFESSMSRPLANQTVTLSFYARAGANYSAASSALKAFAYTGTGTNQGGFPSTWTGVATPVNGQDFTLTTSWQRFTVSYAVGSTATQLGFLWQFTPVGTAGADDWFEITGVQLEAGSVATPFRRNANSIQGELAACQRYYRRINWTAGSSYAFMANGIGASSTSVKLYGFGPEMRTRPSAIDFSSGLYVEDGTNEVAITNLTLDGDLSSTNGYGLVATTSSGITQYRPYILRGRNSVNHYVGFSAEL